MRKEKSSMTNRMLAWLLTFLMVFASIDASGLGMLNVKAATTTGDVCWEDDTMSVLLIKDGAAVEASAFYSLLVEKYGEPPVSKGGSTTGRRGFTYNGITLLSDASGALTLAETDYTVKIGTNVQTGSMGPIKFYDYQFVDTTAGTFEVKWYYAPTISVSGLESGATYDVKLNDVAYNAEHKVFTGENNATLYVAPVSGYTATVTYGESTLDLVNNQVIFTIEESAEISVEYKLDTIPQATVQLVKTGSGAIQNIVDGGKYDLNEPIELIATPEGNFYVKEILVNRVAQTLTSKDATARSYAASITFTEEKGYAVEVVFEEKTLSSKATASVGYHPKKAIANQLDALEEAIFNAVIKNSVEEGNAYSYPDTVDWDDLTYEYYAENEIPRLAKVDAVWSPLDEVPANDKGTTGYGDYAYYAFAAEGVGSTEKVRITWAGDAKYPAVSVEATITLQDNRLTQTAVYNGSDGTAIAPIEYYNIDLLMEKLQQNIGIGEGDGTIGEITIDPSTPLPSQAGQTNAIKVLVDIKEGTEYQATTDYVLLLCVKLTKQPATYTISTTGDGTVTLNGSNNAGGTLTEGSYELVVTPTGTNGYVQSIKVDGNEIADDLSKYENCKFTGSVSLQSGKAHTITVVFATRSITLVDDTKETAVKFNFFYKASEQLDTLKTNILSAVIKSATPGSLSNGDLTLKVYNQTAKIYYAFGGTGISGGIENGLADETFNATSETVQLVWAGDTRYPEVIVSDIAIKVEESRPSNEIIYHAIDKNETFVFNTTDEIDGAVNNAVSAPYGSVNVAISGSHADTTIDGKEQTITYTLTVDETGEYQGATKTITVKVIGEVHPATISVTNDSTKGSYTLKDSEDKAVGNSHEADTLTLKVNPSGNSYVESVTVNGAKLTGTYKEQNFTATFKITNADYQAPNNYQVVITYGTRDILYKQGESVTYNLSSAYTGDVKEQFLKDVYTAVVQGSTPDGISYDDCSIALVNSSKPVEGENGVTITWNSTNTNKYPNVSITTTINVTEERSKATLEAGQIGTVTVDGTVTLADVQSSIEKVLKAPVNADITYELLDDVTLKQGASGTVRVKISVEASTTYLANSITVEIPVTGRVYGAYISVSTTGPGGIAGMTNGEYAAGTYTMTFTPGANGYLDYILLNGVTISTDEMTMIDGSISFTHDFVLENNAGADASEQYRDYSIQVVFGERIIETNDAPYEAEMNLYHSASSQLATLKENIFNAIVDAENTDGISVNDVTVRVWTDGFTVGQYTIAEGYYDLEGVFEVLGYTVFRYADLLITGTNHKATVTWNASGKYPTVTTSEFEINIVDSRAVSGLTDATFEYSTVNVDTVTSAMIQEKYEVDYNPNGYELTYSDVTVEVAQDGKTAVATCTATYAGNETVQPITVTITVNVEILDPQNTVSVSGSGNGTIYWGDIEITGEPINLDSGKEIVLTVVPNPGYAVEEILVFAKADGEARLSDTGVALAEITYNNGTATTSYTTPDITEEGKDFVVVVTYVPATFNYEDERTYELSEGMPTVEDLYDAVVNTPDLNDAKVANNIVGVTEVAYSAEYLARKEGTVTIEIPAVYYAGIKVYAGGVHDVELGELWLTPGTYEEVDVNVLIDEFLAKFENVEELSDVAKLEVYAKEFIEKLPTMHIGGHEFGANGVGSKETVRVTYNDQKYVLSGETDITITDGRIATSIVGSDATVTYGYSEEELRKQLAMSVVDADGNVIEGTQITFAGKAIGFNASETAYKVKVEFVDENNEYQPAAAIFEVTVDKAKASIDYNSQMVKYGTDYEFELVKSPADVQTIDFIIGLDIESMSAEKPLPIGYIHFAMPGALGKLFAKETTLGEFITMLEDLSSKSETLLDAIGVDSQTVEKLLNTINSLTEKLDSEYINDIIIKVNGDNFKPTEVGVYLAGAVTADSNYETAYTADLLIIYPDGTKAELGYRFEDSNGIICSNLITDGIYDLGANAYVNGEYSEAATKEIQHLFLQVDINGEINAVYVESNEDIANHLETLAMTGAYTQISMIMNWGNEIYYGMPVVRPYVVVPELVNVQFVDENGTANNDRIFTFDGTEHALNVVVTDADGNYLSKDEVEKYVTIRYFGYTLNHPDEIYNSTVAPTDAGVYTVVALFADTELGRYGADTAALVIKPAQSSVDVQSQIIKHGDDYDLGINVEPEDCKYLTIIAGIDASGDVSAEDYNPFSGLINIDLPDRLDNVFKNYMPDAYENGIAVSDILAKFQEIKGDMLALGIEEKVINLVESVLENVASVDQTITFADDVMPTNSGMYMVAAATCDPNYELSIDIGYLVIQPKTTKVELKFNYVDENNIFTANYLENIDMGSSVVQGELTNEELAEATESLVNLYIGVNTHGEIVTSDIALTQHGAYAQFAFLLDGGNQIYYASPIMRTYLVVGETVDVKFVDETGTENNERIFKYNGEPQGMKVVVTHNNGTDLSNSNAVAVRYIGYDANDIKIYDSTVPPTNVGTYTVIAVYSDEQLDLFGVAVGVMVIGQAESSIEVPETIINYDGEAHYFDVESTPENLKYITVMKGYGLDGKDLNAYINIDFPEVVDKYLVEVFADAYTEDGMNLAKLQDRLEVLKNVFDKLGLDTAVIDEIMVYVDDLAISPVDTYVTFEDLEAIGLTREGLYVAKAISTDMNYRLTSDIGYLLIMPNATQIKFAGATDVVYNGASHALSATLVDVDGNPIDEDVSIMYVGFGNDGEFYMSSEAPMNAGVYEVIAAFKGNDTYKLSAAVETLVIDKRVIEIEINDCEKLIGAEDPKFAYIIVNEDDKAFLDELAIELTRQPGEVVGTYEINHSLKDVFDNMNFDIDSHNGTLTIKKREIVITANVAGKTYGESDGKLTYTISGDALLGEDTYEDIFTVELSREDGENAGEYLITVEAAINEKYGCIYDVTVVDGAFTIAQAGNSWTTGLSMEGWTYSEAAKEPSAAAKFGTVTYKYYADAACTEEIAKPTEAGTYYVKATVEETTNYAGLEEVKAFTIAQAQNSWTTALSIQGWNKGETANKPFAAAVAGTVTYKYYADEACKNEISEPTEIGTYYVKAFASETRNYTALESKVVSFTISTTIELVTEELQLEEIGALTGNRVYVRGFTLGSSVENLIDELKAIDGAILVSFRNDAGEEITTGIVSTGMEFTVQIGEVKYDRIIVIMGDTNGDGKVQATDYRLIKNQIMDEEIYLFDEYALAADIDGDGNIYATDYKAIRNHIMEIKEIVQQVKYYN